MRLDALDGLRGIAALLVMLSHMWLTLWPVYTPHPSVSWLRHWQGFILLGHFSVDFFIVLSGFCLMLPVLRTGQLAGGAWTFYKRRFRRIVPPFWAALIFSSALLLTVISRKTGTHWDICVPFTKTGFLINALLLQDIRTGGINHAFWSIAVEWHIYFLFPIIVYCRQRFGSLKTTVVTLAAGYILTFFIKHFVWIGPTFQYLGLFALGTYTASEFCKPLQDNPGSANTARRPWGLIAGALAAATALWCWVFGWQWVMTHYGLVDLLVGFCAAAVLACVSQTNHPILRALSLRPLVWIGTFAYSLYLIHAPLVQVVWQYLFNPLHLSDTATFFLLTTAGSLLILGAAYGFHLVFERPFMSKPSPKTEKQAEIAAVVNPAP